MADTTTESASEILDRSIRSLASSTQITKLTPGGKARSLLGIVAAESERLGNVLTANMILGLLNGASDIYLDFIGAIVGTPRVQESTAESNVYSENIRIFVPDGFTAGGLNSGGSITIPGGTAVSSQDGAVTYYTTHTAIIPPTGTEVFVGARSAIRGSRGNVTSGTLSRLGFTNYTQYPNNILRVENLYSIDNGRADETDQVYKYRIQNAYLAAESSNLTSIRLAALKVPSVADMSFLNMYRGIGTADIVLDTVTGEVSNSAIQQVRSAIAGKIAVGVDVKVRPPRLVGLEVSVRVKFVPGATNAQKVEAGDAMRQAIATLVASTPLGGTLLINDIAFAARSASQYILDIGNPNAPLEEVLLWRESRLTIRAPLIIPRNKDIELAVDQRLTLEGGIKAAIRIL